jgi:hypothetical protein
LEIDADHLRAFAQAVNCPEVPGKQGYFSV